MSANSLLVRDKNCWRIERAERAACLIDGSRYFRAFRTVAMNAQRSLRIIGWDIDSRLDIAPDGPADGMPGKFGEFLIELVRRRSSLEIHVLDWDFLKLYAPEREWLSFVKLGMQHERLHYRMDGHYPAGASHHQKVVVVDDRVAFVGGLDFALGRWDTSDHLANDPRRRGLDGEIAQPYHDIQMMVSGPCAEALGDLARDRWHTATGETLSVTRLTDEPDSWPAGIVPDFEDVDIGIARTIPQYGEQAAKQEIRELLIDAIGAAKRTIYIENQYLTAEPIGDALAARLAEENGPEVVIVLPRNTVGWLSQMTMDVLRERLIRKLRACDGNDRLRLYYPDDPALGEQCINVHSKIMIVDDALLRVGTANFNHRSLGLDTECDIAIESLGRRRVAEKIGAIRNRLVAEHLHTTMNRVADSVTANGGSLGKAIDALRGSERTLAPLEYYVPEDLDKLVPAADLADPDEPVEIDYFAEKLVDPRHGESTSRPILRLAIGLIAALAIAASWRWTPLADWVRPEDVANWFGALRGDWRALPAVVLLYVLAGLVVFPVTLLIIGTGAVFGAWPGFAYALLGAVASASAAYAIGHYAGRGALSRLTDRWASRVSRQLARQGLLAVITLRIIPVAPFTVVNLVAGASHIRFRSFVLGTVIGMAPAILGFTVFSDQLIAALVTPGTARLAGLAAVAVLFAAAAWWLRRWVVRRQRA